MMKFDEIYSNIVGNILKYGIVEKNERTGHETKALPGIHFTTDIEKDGFPLLTLRKIPIKLFVSEKIWFFSASKNPEDFLRNKPYLFGYKQFNRDLTQG